MSQNQPVTKKKKNSFGILYTFCSDDYGLSVFKPLRGWSIAALFFFRQNRLVFLFFCFCISDSTRRKESTYNLITFLVCAAR